VSVEWLGEGTGPDPDPDRRARRRRRLPRNAAGAAGGGVSGGDAMPDITLIGIAEGSFPASDAESMALAAEVLRLRDRGARAETVRDDAADAYDILVRRVWEAATGDTHEGPASVDVLLEAVAGLRARAEKAEAARDALRAAAREYLRGGSMASYRALAERVGLVVREG
jgi:hypothetical protein